MKHFHDPNAALHKEPALSKSQRVWMVITIAALIAWIVCGWVLK
jgi:hypothetical protein